MLKCMNSDKQQVIAYFGKTVNANYTFIKAVSLNAKQTTSGSGSETSVSKSFMFACING